MYATLYGQIQTGFRVERRRENLKISLLQYAADVDYKRAGSYEGINRETLCYSYRTMSLCSNLIRFSPLSPLPFLPKFHDRGRETSLRSN